MGPIYFAIKYIFFVTTYPLTPLPRKAEQLLFFNTYYQVTRYISLDINCPEDSR